MSGIKQVMAGFREFVMRGNVVDLATAVVVGAAFTAVIKAFTDFVINPVLAVFGGLDTQGFGFQLTANPATFIDLGAVLTAATQFLITAAVIYFLFVLPMRKVRELNEEPQPEPQAPPKPAEVELLEQIRDLLAQDGATRGRPDTPEPGTAARPDAEIDLRAGVPARQG